jgi:hypothetical protein
MRRAFLVSSLASTCACVFFFACGATDDSAGTGTSNSTDDGGGGQSSSSGGLGSSGGPSDGGGGTQGPDSGARAPNGCFIYATAMASGVTVENFPGAGLQNWTSLSGALKEDGQVASVVLDKGQESATLRVKGFGLSVPATAATWGIIVELKRQTLTADGILQTSYVNVEIPNKPTQNKFDADKFFWPRSIIGTHPYGQEVDTWGVDLLPSDVTPAEFAAVLRVKRGTDNVAGPVTGTVDSLRVQVWYATGDDKSCKR